MKSDNKLKEDILLELIRSLQIFGKNYVEALLDTLRERKEKLSNINDNYPKNNILTHTALIIFSHLLKIQRFQLSELC